MKVIVIGLDGATWNLLKPWVDKGKLPTIKKMMEDGIWGHLKSTIPTSTFPAWKCYSTGKNPGKLGAYFWFIFNRETKQIKVVDSTMFKSKEIWDYLSAGGYTCGVINMPTTFPPKEINGFMIAGFNALDHLEYTYPKVLKQELREKFAYQVNISDTLRLHDNEAEVSKRRDKVIDEVLKLIRMRFNVASYLMQKNNLDFLHITIFYIDHLQHYLWKYKDMKGHKYSRALEQAWMLIDEQIKKFIPEKEKDTIVILMSDHGFQKLKATFQMNLWLQKKGYLTLRKKQKFSLADIFRIIGLDQRKAVKIYRRVKWVGKLLKIIPYKILQKAWFKMEIGRGEPSFFELIECVDWSKTKAVMLGEGILFINIKDKRGYEKFREKLKEELLSIRDPRTGEHIIAEVYDGEHIYKNAVIDIPDLLIVPSEGYSLSIGISQNPDEKSEDECWIYSHNDGFNATHDSYGIFVAYGPKIKKGYIKEVSIYDLAPTILFIFGLPVPSDMDGRPLTEIFESDLGKEENIIYVKPIFYGEKMKDELKRKIKRLKEKRKF